MSESLHPKDPERPDLDENLNVSQVHAEVLRQNASTAREKIVRENGMEPISLWFILVAAAIAMVCGVILGRGPGLFTMGGFVREDYSTAKAPKSGGSEIPPMKAKDALMMRGKKVYSKCTGCHGGSGAGGSGYPPLAGSEWVTGNTETLAMIILHGLKGPISVKGASYDNNMPAQGSGMNAIDLAAVMTYVKNEWGNNSGIVSPSQAQSALDITQSGQMTSALLKEKHNKDLAGDKLEADTMVDYETLAPAGK